MLLEAEYSAFGVRSASVDAAGLTVGFAGGVFDADTGLTRFGARDYDAQVGRWTAKDPVTWAGGQSNLFTYARLDPVNFSDASGLWTFQLGGQFTVCLGICGTINPNLVCDGSGEADVNFSASLGLSSGYAGVSLGPTAEWTNASSISELNGLEGFVGGSITSEVAYASGNVVAGGTYTGANVSAGIGGGWGLLGPAEVHAGGTLGINLIQALREAFK